MIDSNEVGLICSVSANGDCVALCTSDGVIKFYDTLTSNLKLEYTSSTHLQAACTCLSWSKFKRNVNIWIICYKFCFLFKLKISLNILKPIDYIRIK